MKKNSTQPRSRKELLIRISELKGEQKQLELEIGEGIQNVYTQLNPVRIIRNSLTEVLRSDAEDENPVIIQGLLNRAVGLVMPDKLLQKVSGKIGGVLLSKGVQTLVTNLLINNRESIGNGIMSLWDKIQTKVGKVRHHSNGSAGDSEEL